MKFRKSLLILSSALLCSSSLSLYARPEAITTMAERCELGASCPIPANDDGLTYFVVTPANGNNYHCEVTATKDGELTFYVRQGKDYKIANGSGLYHANPSVTIDVSGGFSKPNEPEDVGQIKFMKITGGQGTVTCKPA